MCHRTRVRAGGALGALILGLYLASPAAAGPQPFSIERFAAGTIVAGVQTNGQQMAMDLYPGFEFSVIGNGASNSLCVFDSAHPTGGDLDLGSPNVGFGGPGQGSGGAPGSPGANKIPQGKILVIPENMLDVNHDGRVDSPDDNHLGGQITVRWDIPGIVLDMTFIDIEEIGATVDFYLGNQLVQSFPIPAYGDNSQVKVQTLTNTPIDRTVINLPGSGALAVMTYDFYVVPVEATTWSGIKNLTQH